MKTGLCLLLVCLAAVVQAAPASKPLQLLEERPVTAMSGGNLSGLAWCQGALWALSDRDDRRLYRLHAKAGIWQAEVEQFSAPLAPPSGLSWGQQVGNWGMGVVRGGELDFEGLSCDAAGNRYLLSEAQVAVLKLPVEGSPSWLPLPANLVSQARVSGLFWQFNGLVEGLAVNPDGTRLWLAAERQNRGLLALQQQTSGWACGQSCVLLSESAYQRAPAQMGGERLPLDFADLAFYEGKLFTLERLQLQVCRRNPADGAVERCWSFADTALAEARRYPLPYGVAEALAVDAEGAWIGLDNGASMGGEDYARGDGERRPIIWRFAAPAGGWGASS